MSVLEYRDIHRSYRAGEEVLSGVAFRVDAGEVVGLLGRNGVGKTTLIHIALGMIRPQEGEVRIFDLDPFVDPVAIKRRLGFVSENQLLPPAMSVKQVLEFHRELFPTWDRQLEQELRGRFEFGDGQRIKTLSKGQARQLALLCAVAHRPELLLLDEPAGGLDPAARREFLEMAIQLLAESGTAILFSSHHMSDVERMAQRVVLLDGGRVLVDSDLDELRESCVVAVVSRDASFDSERLRQIDGCLRIRSKNGSVHSVFRGDPTEVELRVREQAGVTDVSCRRMPLEDLFVELVGGAS